MTLERKLLKKLYNLHSKRKTKYKKAKEQAKNERI